ncbi:MAG: hypothetical protein ABI539_01965 [Acidobacteriota bacterium]
MRQAVGPVRGKVDIQHEIVTNGMNAFDREPDTCQLGRQFVSGKIDLYKVF